MIVGAVIVCVCGRRRRVGFEVGHRMERRERAGGGVSEKLEGILT